MDYFAIRLSNVTDSYYGFVVAVLTYVKKKQSRRWNILWTITHLHCLRIYLNLYRHKTIFMKMQHVHMLMLSKF
ncbi:hypothetical protein DXB15_08020 [Roseburia sp. OM02-15]|nr:hypothetical protein DXB15_08020 [Roseburia sp. OM02-15]